MTISINYIEGRRQSACKNDSFTIVENEGNDTANVLAFIPADALAGKDRQQVSAVFTAAVKGCPDSVIRAVSDAAQKLRVPGCTL